VLLHFFNQTTVVGTFELFIFIEGGWQQPPAFSKSMILLGHYISQCKMQTEGKNEGSRFLKYTIGLFA